MDDNNLQVLLKHHQMGVMDYLRQLLVSEVFVDVTLCCQNKRFKAHRILLSACSSYLQQVLVEHLASDHVTIILPDIHPDDMQWLLDFMYTGSVAVPRCRLSSFLQAAEALHIKVLTDMAQLRKGSEIGSVVCIPSCSTALDVKLTNRPNFQNHLINSNTHPYNIKPYNLTEDFKHPSCNDDAKIPTDSSRLLSNKQEFKTVTEDRKSCMFKSPMGNSSYVPSVAQNPVENDSVLCKETSNTPSLYDGLSKVTEIHKRNKEEDSSSTGAVLVTNGCNAKMVHNAVNETNASAGCSSENLILSYLKKQVHNKSYSDTEDTAEHISTNHNSDSSPAYHSGKLVKIPQVERGCNDPNDRVAPSGEGGSSLELSSNNNLHISTTASNNKISPSSVSPQYRQDMRVTEELPLKNQHKIYQAENAEHYKQYPQRLSQWPKPLPSLMPISSNSYQCNGQISPDYLIKDGRINGVMTQLSSPMDRKDMLPEHLQSMEDIIPNTEPDYQTAGQHLLKEHRCVRSVWLYGRDKAMYLNGQRPASDCRPSRRLSQRAPRLSPIVPPSPWAQNHRPPCATPIVCPPRGGSIRFSYQPVSWVTSQQTVTMVQTSTCGNEETPPIVTAADHQQPLGDITRPHSSTQVPNANPTGHITKCRSPDAKHFKIPENNSNNIGSEETASIRSRSKRIDMFCKLKERRLQEFYREQMTLKLKTGGKESQKPEDEVVSDLSTKPSQSPERNPHSNGARSSPSEYQKTISSPLAVPLQQKLNTSQLSAPKSTTYDERLSYKDSVKESDNKKSTKGCDIDVNNLEMKTEPTNSVPVDDKKLQLEVTKQMENEEKDERRICFQEGGDMQILNDARRTTLTKNDSNNNNNNGPVDESAQVPAAAKSHGCEDCGKCFSRRQLLVQHRRIHTGERPYSCADCGRQFTQRGHWSTHQKLHEPARRPEHACPSCGKAFVTRASLKVHLRTHTGEKPFQCGECGKQFSQLRNYKYHRSVHEGTREFAATCPECGKYFNDRGYLSSHMKIHRNRKEYGCQYCGKSFNQRVAYNMHVRIHTGERPHSCPHCNKSFSRKMLLKQHLRIHTGEKPFACSVCGKAFADRSNMTLHMRLHSGIKPYSCQLCAKAFTKKHHLKTHLNYHTGTKPYSCTKCGLRFSQSSNMRTHYKKCTSTGLTNVETSVNKTETSTAPSAENNGATSPSSSPGRSDVTTPPRPSSAVITPPHSDESSCGSSVISRNATEPQAT